MSKANLTPARLRELLHYDPETGVFTWRVQANNNRARVGAVAGTPHRRGYIHIGVGGFQYLAHRLAWLYAYGVWPTGHIDHVDGCKTNNALANLRDVSRAINMQNLKGPRRDNQCGYLGVSVNKKRWKAEIFVNGRRRHIGTYDTPELAHEAYLAAKRHMHEGCTL